MARMAAHWTETEASYVIISLNWSVQPALSSPKHASVSRAAALTRGLESVSICSTRLLVLSSGTAALASLARATRAATRMCGPTSSSSAQSFSSNLASRSPMAPAAAILTSMFLLPRSSAIAGAELSAFICASAAQAAQAGTRNSAGGFPSMPAAQSMSTSRSSDVSASSFATSSAFALAAGPTAPMASAAAQRTRELPSAKSFAASGSMGSAFAPSCPKSVTVACRTGRSAALRPVQMGPACFRARSLCLAKYVTAAIFTPLSASGSFLATSSAQALPSSSNRVSAVMALLTTSASLSESSFFTSLATPLAFMLPRAMQAVARTFRSLSARAFSTTWECFVAWVPSIPSETIAMHFFLALSPAARVASSSMYGMPYSPRDPMASHAASSTSSSGSCSIAATLPAYPM
mmetsp:Transcript_39192/g.110798  ORF Transcript_39192/g.110798 Transcript_39192/m.110798 type:complete len:408 (+) Transcript_39192:483-1706(+)